jgi:hypothetical protein
MRDLEGTQAWRERKRPPCRSQTLAIESTQDLQNRAIHQETAIPIEHLLGHYAEITKFYFKALIATRH